MKVAILTSFKSVSLKKVSRDIAAFLESKGIRTVLHQNIVLDPTEYNKYDAVIIVMTFDPLWAVNYFYTCYRIRSLGKKCLFYTTIEGNPIMPPTYHWIKKQLSFIANSQYTKKKLEGNDIVVEKVIYHGVNTEFYKSISLDREELESRIGTKLFDIYALYIAGGYPRKGHSLFSKVVEICKDVNFVVLTDSKGVKHYARRDNLIVLPLFGNLSEIDIISLYKHATIYVQASLSEGFGLPVLEALACGKIVVHPDYAPLNEITSPDTSWRIPVRGIDYDSSSGGIEYELHYYKPEEMCKAIKEAMEAYENNRKYYENKALARAEEFAIPKVYKEFLPLLGSGV